MIEATAPSEELWQFDVHVKRSGWFSVYAKSAEEARQMVDEMDLDKRVIQWTETEVTGID